MWASDTQQNDDIISATTKKTKKTFSNNKEELFIISYANIKQNPFGFWWVQATGNWFERKGLTFFATPLWRRPRNDCIFWAERNSHWFFSDRNPPTYVHIHFFISSIVFISYIFITVIILHLDREHLAMILI